jgi:DNA-binding NarL/FixJ family response regulator
VNRILIADDHPAVRSTLRCFLIAYGFAVCGEAANGLEAVEMAQSVRPDLIVLDLHMPVLDGLGAARELSRLLPDVPLIMLTNHTGKIAEEDALKAGVRRMISKEDVAKKLVPVVREVFSLKGDPAAESAARLSKYPSLASDQGDPVSSLEDD